MALARATEQHERDHDHAHGQGCSYITSSVEKATLGPSARSPDSG